MSRLVIVAPLRDGAREQARRLVAEGPPFDLEGSDLTAHQIYLSDHEAIFVFEGAVPPRTAVERLAGDPGVWRAAVHWRECLAGRPRIAEEAFAWTRASGA